MRTQAHQQRDQSQPNPAPGARPAPTVVARITTAQAPVPAPSIYDERAARGEPMFRVIG
jgi:hypothetical protein